MNSSNPQRKRVVVTGLGAVTPLGNTVHETWSNALEGKSGVGPITLFDPEGCSVTIAAEVKNFDPTSSLSQRIEPSPGKPVEQICSKKDLKKMGRFCHLSLGASFEAYIDSGLDAYRKEFSSNRFGVNIGVGMGGLPEIEKNHDTIQQKGYKRVTPFFIPSVITNMASGLMSIHLDMKGPNLCNVTACTSSAREDLPVLSIAQSQAGPAVARRCLRIV